MRQKYKTLRQKYKQYIFKQNTFVMEKERKNIKRNLKRFLML